MKKITQIKVTQIKSIIGQTKKQKNTMKALGLRKLNHSVRHQATPAILGMLAKVKHLVSIQ